MRLALPARAMGFGLAVLISLAAGCSEQKPEDADVTLPNVSILAPRSADRLGYEVKDSTDIVVAATDNDRIARVEFYFHTLGSSQMNAIGGPVVEPDNAGYYRTRWNTAGIQNGSQCYLRATATDPSGNVGASESVPVQIVNTEGIRRPYASFVAMPSEGTILTEFCFDPSLTRDDLSDNVDLFVQWDFQDDGIWDHTLDEHLTATKNDIVCHTYPIPDTYTVVLEVYNQYYSVPLNIPDVYKRTIIVKPAHGNPRPPLEEEFVRVPDGDYLLGAVRCTPGPGCDVFDSDEAVNDTLIVRISNPFFIDKYEVTNRLYVKFLNAAMDSGSIDYEFAAREVRRRSDSKLLLTLKDDLTRVKFQFADSSFWADDVHLEHPVTGVTWYGAYEYAAFYGLRLPTEAEWEAAARIQEPSWMYSYPWTDHEVIDQTYANYFNSGDPYEGDIIATAPVGSYQGGYLGGFLTHDAVSRSETYDQAGNVAEWCSDWFSSTAYEELAAQPVIPIDPQGAPVGRTRSIRGGSWAQYPHEVRTTNRQAADPRLAAAWLGFRTAYTVY